MAYYLSLVSDPKKKLTLQNFNGLLNANLIPDSLSFEKNVFNINKHLKNNVYKDYYCINNEKLYNYLTTFINENDIDIINSNFYIKQAIWDKFYKDKMKNAKNWLADNQDELLKNYNYKLFLDSWEKYAQGNISAWEMESLCFYYNEHELSHINNSKYGIVNFFQQPEKPAVDYYYKRNDVDIPIYKIQKIAGTVLGKNNTNHSIDLLTTFGVVTVKFTKEYYALFNKQISERDEVGKKTIKETGWFVRGTKLLIAGFRREDTWVAKTYKKNNFHQLYKITEVKGNDIVITHDRYQIEE